MKKGKFIVLEGIYGSSKVIVRLVNKLREVLARQGNEVYEIDSPDSGRAQLMGAQDLDGSWRYGVFVADFFFELASRARVCSAVRQELERGRIVLCKNFTISSIVHARLKDHDWFSEDLYNLEARARSFGFGVKVVPDLTVFLDVPPEYALEELGEKINGHFEPSDLYLQQKYFLEEVAKLPKAKVKIINAERHEDDVFAETLAAVQALLKH